jgi:DNA-binding MarR family transcriptional regulator
MVKSSMPRPAASTHALAADLRTLVGRLRRRLREQADMGELTASQVAALTRLQSDGPATVTQLAQAEHMRPQSMGAVVKSLAALGLVAAAPHPGDGRKTLLSLSPACLDWVDAGRAAREDWLSHAIEDTLTPAEQQALARAIDLLRRLADA